jgi:hypothetical protein
MPPTKPFAGSTWRAAVECGLAPIGRPVTASIQGVCSLLVLHEPRLDQRVATELVRVHRYHDGTDTYELEVL